MGAGYPLEQLEPSADAPPGTPAQILMRATAEADSIRELARAEGHAEGLTEGRDAGLAALEAAANALQNALTELDRQGHELAQSIEGDAVEFALALAAKIVAGTLEAQPERVLDVVSGALRRIADRRRIVIVVDPDDLETVSAAIAQLTAQAGGIELCEVHADRRVGRGGAIVRTVESEVDVTVQTQLERAREAITEELGREGPSR